MKKIILLFIGLSLFTCKSSSFKEVPEKDKIRILIAKADPEIYKLVKEKFESTGQFRIISPDDQDKALSKLKDCSTKDCTFELGKVLFAKLLLTYTTETVLQGDYTLYSYKIADVNKGIYLASSYGIFYSAGKDKYKNVLSNLFTKYAQNYTGGKEEHDIVHNEFLFRIFTKYAEDQKGKSFYDTVKDEVPLQIDQRDLIDELIHALEKRMVSKTKNKLRIVFSNIGFFEELFKSEMILYEEVELIDNLTIEKTLKQLKKKQQCGIEDCDVQLGKIFLADFLFSCKLLRSTIREVQTLPQIYDMKNAKFKDLDFKNFWIENTASVNFGRSDSSSGDYSKIPPNFTNVEIPGKGIYETIFDSNIDSMKTQLINKRLTRVYVNFLLNYTFE